MILGRLGREQERSGRGWFRWGATQVALVSVLGLAGCGGDGAEGGDPCSQERTGDNEPVDSFCVSGTIEPAWADSDPLPPVSIDSAQDQSPRLAVYLDVSSPMSGFVPPPGMESDSGSVPGGELRPVAQWIPDQLVRAYPGVPIQWYSVAEAVEQMGQRPIIQRDIFTGTQSRLNLAVDSILTHLRTGRSEGAAIITDLMGTGELIGALAVAQYLIPWLASEERRGNDFRFALIGVRGTYWGAFPSYCPRQGGPLGCWFSESIGDWKPRLKRPVSVPFYVLLFGRSAAALNEIARSITQDAASLGIETVWELFTATGTERRDVNIEFCVFPADGRCGDPQYTLGLNDDATYKCYPTGGTVRLWGTFAGQGGFRPQTAALAAASGGSDSPFTAAVVGERLELEVDCDAADTSTDDLRVTVEGTVLPPPRPDWSDWSTPTDDTPEHPGATLQLRYFVVDTRHAATPISYRMDLTVLRAADR